jgi:hypothetical protein
MTLEQLATAPAGSFLPPGFPGIPAGLDAEKFTDNVGPILWKLHYDFKNANQGNDPEPTRWLTWMTKNADAIAKDCA